jgi:hypothetical protein
LPLTLPAAATRVVVHHALRRWADTGRSFGRKSIPALVSGSATPASSDVVNLRGGVGCEAPCLVFDFRGENLSSVDRRGDDSVFDVAYFMEGARLKSNDRLQFWRNGLVSGWRFDWCMGGDED